MGTKRKAGPAGKGVTDEVKAWAAIEVPIKMLTQLVSLQHVGMAQRPAGGPKPRSLRQIIDEMLDAVESPDELRVRHDGATLSEMKAKLVAATRADRDALARGFGDRLRKEYLAQQIDHAAKVLPTIVRASGPPAATMEEWIAREEAEDARVDKMVAASGARIGSEDESRVRALAQMDRPREHAYPLEHSKKLRVGIAKMAGVDETTVRRALKR